jgi:hypothetical protein
LAAKLKPGHIQLAGIKSESSFRRRPGGGLLRHDVRDRPIIDVAKGKLVQATDPFIPHLGREVARHRSSKGPQ